MSEEEELAKALAHHFDAGIGNLYVNIPPEAIEIVAGLLLASGWAKRDGVAEEARNIKDAPRDGRTIWAHIRADLPPRYPEQEYETTTSAWADRWAPIKHGGVYTYEDGHQIDMHWTIALPVGYGGITDDWFDDWTESPVRQLKALP